MRTANGNAAKPNASPHGLSQAASFSSDCLLVLAAAGMTAASMTTTRGMFAPAVRCRRMGLGVGCVGVRTAFVTCGGMGGAGMSRARVGGTGMGGTSAVVRFARTDSCRVAGRIGASRRRSAAAVVSASPIIDEAMPAPAVLIAPASPGAHAKEYPVVEIAGSVEAHRRAGVGSVVVVTVGANRLDADADDHLRLSRWRQSSQRTGCHKRSRK